MKFSRSLFLAALLLAPLPALAQNGPPTPAPFSVLAGQVTLAVTASSGRVALPSTATYADAITIYNSGPKNAFFKFGNSSVLATTAGIELDAGKHLTVFSGNQTNLAAICGGADTTTLVIYQANGPIDFGP